MPISHPFTPPNLEGYLLQSPFGHLKGVSSLQFNVL